MAKSVDIKTKLGSLGMNHLSGRVSQLLQTLTTRARLREPEKIVLTTTTFPVFDFQNKPNMYRNDLPLTIKYYSPYES